MFAFLNVLFSSQNFIPHGHCYLWKPELVWLHVISDSAIALAYFSIPILLVVFVSKRSDLPFNWIFLLFGTFIISCGTGHLVDIWTLWHPMYWFSGLVKAITAIVSLFTALEMVPLMPKVLALPSPAMLESTNRELEKQILERKRANEELQKSEARFKAFMNNSPALAFIKDEQGKLLYVNQQYETVFDQTLASLEGLTTHERFPKPIADQIRENDLLTFKNNQPIEVVEVVPLPDGSLRNWLVVKFPIQDTQELLIGGFAFDITERQQMAEALRQNTAQLEQALSFEAVLKRITDKVRDSLDEHQILQIAVQELGIGLGVRCCIASLYDLDLGTSTISYEYTSSMFPRKGRVVALSEQQPIYQQLLQGQHFQFCFTKLDPIHGRFATFSCPIVDDQGVLGDLWLINDRDYAFRDLEQRVVQQVANQCAIAIRQARLFQAAQAQVEDLERLNRLKDDFLSTVSHELRTPMSNIKMATQMLEVSLRQAGLLNGETNRVSRYFKILQDEGRREISLINDLLDLSRLDVNTEPLILSTIDHPEDWLNKLVEPFVERARTHEQFFVLKLPSVLPPLTTDIAELESILTELLTNACKYTPHGESITISAELTTAGLEFQVSNSGVELPAGETDRVFDKFYRVPNHDPWKYGGTGLGLALVKKRVARIGGSIAVQSRSQCVTFAVKLPCLVAVA